ncbi:hypothetical protein G4X40_18480 [Rhodococcus sp. D2-41]|uniref:hypothetical protein n=1 Tax=Speluncibacter jeojiensis TaxID=2710754 RepID=UPI00240F2498|nr:hypothetical protein [Rhodococcus sp. D2-41]MDG3012132.1 hypothetical protein [Rhodococcus sp. D2-41]
MATGTMYGKFLLSALNKEVKIASSANGGDTLKIMLVTSAYSPDKDAHQYKAQVTSEAVGTGYTAGGLTLNSVAVTYDAGTDTVNIAAANPEWPASTITARYAVIYDDTPATNKPLIGWIDFGGDVSTTAGKFAVTLDALGFAGLTAA